MAIALLGLGANLGDRAAQLNGAVEQLGRAPDVTVLRQSRWYETAPVGGAPGQQAFLNGAALIETALEPMALLQVLEGVEARCWTQTAEAMGCAHTRYGHLAVRPKCSRNVAIESTSSAHGLSSIRARAGG